MRALIADDDFISRRILQEMLLRYGACHVAVHGGEAVSAMTEAFKSGEPYDLVCLDIRMPEVDGQQALREIRAFEAQHGLALGRGVKVLMVTAAGDGANVREAFRQECDGYLVKPIDRAKLVGYLEQFGLAAPTSPTR